MEYTIDTIPSFRGALPHREFSSHDLEIRTWSHKRLSLELAQNYLLEACCAYEETRINEGIGLFREIDQWAIAHYVSEMEYFYCLYLAE